jgi:hypothetical protein
LELSNKTLTFARNMTNMDLSKLVKLSTYAKKKGVSYEYIRQLCNANQIESVVIDGVRFVVLDDKEN